MHLKFAYAETSKASDGEASSGKAATVAAVPADEATIASTGDAAHCAANIAHSGQDNKNGTQTAPGFTKGMRTRGAPRAVFRSASDPATTRRVTDFTVILTHFNSVQPDAIMYGGMNAASVPLTKRSTFGIGAKILAGHGVRAGKAVGSALGAVRNRASSRAGLALAKRHLEASFAMRCEVRFRTPVRSCAPAAHGADGVRAAVDAMTRAASIKVLEVPNAMPVAPHDGVPGQVASADLGASVDGAITLYDFKDSARAVLDVVNVQ